MLTSLTQVPLSQQPEVAREAPAPDLTEAATQEPGEYELVLGRGQIASVLFVATVALVVFSAMSYLAGKSSAPRKGSAPPPEVQTAVPQQFPLPQPFPSVQASILPPAPKIDPSPAADPQSGPEPPLFADPAKGAIYLQMGAVEPGIAVIFVEGLRKRGFQSFAAPGPSEKIFRVLIGPLPDPKAFLRAKDAVDQIGLATFARKYEQ